MGAAEWAYVVVILAACGLAGWLAVRRLSQLTTAGTTTGAIFLVASVVAPFLLAYGWLDGVLAAGLGAAVGAIQRFRHSSNLGRLVLVVTASVIALGPLTWLELGNISAYERIDRCQGNVAIATIDGDRAQNGYYPRTVHDFAVDSDSYDDQNCPLLQGVNWLYRASPRGYTVGYWVSWLVASDVCLHSSGQQGWTCGLNQWGPFKPGETD